MLFVVIEDDDAVLSLSELDPTIKWLCLFCGSGELRAP